ncbi:UDP-N-acetylmuramate dehydrogenase [Candidatus Cetobacterium colombiensis]|uniref:UDP-N-acetylenolpyruvoylglucosamine reductase n=1 Tax=Candidatus Cetobacterium colombiensis TaxID=3073100 RepID=A0ABU4WA67_9FUSO|nr:UDP-N-acetylmuramate dehydrogenase [Candidatus Cetobacterium colombiensis]MDX8336435.1 UDP-N-acetylmuramate dehydrogenase [Candidatus Cetobacterium colombiensis]
MKLYKNHLMKNYSNMKIGGIAKEFIEIENRDELIEILKEKKNRFILGNGTNTLINDGELETTFISLKAIDYIKDENNGVVEVGAGLDFSDLIDYMEEKDYTGLENLAGIPGSVGGLVFMNGGAHGTEVFDRIVSVEIVDENNELRRIKKEDLKFSYRVTEIKEKNWVVVSATFKFDKGYLKEVVDKYKLKRSENHPLNEPNLGSTFKNPEGYFSARLIIEAGLQGKQIGGAEVSMVHPNFIVNKGEAKFSDIIEIINHVKLGVKDKTGIELEEEIIIVRN